MGKKPEQKYIIDEPIVKAQNPARIMIFAEYATFTTSMIHRILLIAFGILGIQLMAQCQGDPKYRVACIGFYNVENLFDTIDQPEVNDVEFTPTGPNAWGNERYQEKLQNLSEVISKIGTDISPDGVAVLGLSEIENRSVIEDLISMPLLRSREYAIVHYDSPDRRGVDVGLIYQPKYFRVTNSRSYRLVVEGEPNFLSRDQLLVSGYLDGEPLHIIVNHWPSRRGGEQSSRHLRNAAADLSRRIVDSLQQLDPQAKVMVMGDLNDDPVNMSVRHHLRAVGKTKNLDPSRMYNPMEDLFQKGIGSLAYRDSWNLFDQIIVTPPLAYREQKGWFLYGTRVFNKEFLKQKTGSFKGYPFRSFAGGSYLGGYSDHFPVYVILAKPE